MTKQEKTALNMARFQKPDADPAGKLNEPDADEQADIWESLSRPRRRIPTVVAHASAMTVKSN
ncbi:Rop family plasmid primer RNA-binding protein [Escherichia coli]|uniref:Rop family plasmid primer RNA-binding protein n=1 Tax=Escherichia coli TaxID=562 RepID=UPI00388D4B09